MRTGRLTNRDHCVQIPHGHNLDVPSWNIDSVFCFVFNGEIVNFNSVNECVSKGKLIIYTSLFFFFFRVKMAEECFKQAAREKASYNVKPKHATGIVRLHTSRSYLCFFYVYWLCFLPTLSRVLKQQHFWLLQ